MSSNPADQTVEGIITACAASPIGRTLGADALRIAVNAHRESVIVGREVHLQALWDMFKEQGFDDDSVSSALCRIKLLEAHMGVEVMLPAPLHALSLADLAARATATNLDAQDLAQAMEGARQRRSRNTLLRLGDVAARPMRRVKRHTVEGARVTAEAVQNLAGPKVRWVPIAILMATLLAFSGYQLVSGDSETELPKELFAAMLPVSEAVRAGSQVHLIVTDADWFKSSRRAQADAMHKVFNTLRPDGVDSVVVLYGAERHLRARIGLSDKGSVELTLL